MRLIDADAFEAVLSAAVDGAELEVADMDGYDNGSSYKTYCRGWSGALSAAMAYLKDKMPTVDPVKHGKWEEDIATDWRGFNSPPIPMCSVCKAHSVAPYDYCPACGAKMERDDD